MTKRPPQKRGVGFVFQHYAAFKHMTVRDNVAFGLKVRRRPRAEVRRRVDELLELVQIAGWADNYPAQLSGGQRQRMGLARALAVEPAVLLLDEPFGALDARVRKDLRAWLRRLHDEMHVTTIFVTHDQEEAMEIADQIVLMNRGRIEQVGGPRDLYEEPANEFVMSFVGPVNRFGESFVRPHDLELRIEPNGETTAGTIERVVHPRVRGAASSSCSRTARCSGPRSRATRPRSWSSHRAARCSSARAARRSFRRRNARHPAIQRSRPEPARTQAPNGSSVVSSSGPTAGSQSLRQVVHCKRGGLAAHEPVVEDRVLSDAARARRGSTTTHRWSENAPSGAVGLSARTRMTPLRS